MMIIKRERHALMDRREVFPFPVSNAHSHILMPNSCRLLYIMYTMYIH